MAEDEFDDLVDNATHAVNNLIPSSLLAGMDAEGRSHLLNLINDALAPILRDLGPPESGDAGSARTRLSTMAAFLSELIETHIDKCENAGGGPDERPPHIVSEAFGTQAYIASIATSSRIDAAHIHVVFEDGDAFRLTIKRVGT
ncbi:MULTISPECIES: hypothetical protein [Sphingopyxis]|jgi:hypothetical protein|uniref:Uncharacterized protein n=2 Tax=Sphingopyxis TaxID=165697 RepID=A0A142VTV8_9SPHN|nr:MULTISPECIES: hypothetical protein [Sphingopyxis]AMU93216.1 hypothetical protein AOA14_01190 [Sphingopyxis terrae subsp. terrae NBRC 15098]MCM3420657.1 hypothetical protein [Sphingopyxis alaskensis]MDZ3832984.1 hypothetical protein [Sphingopyxis sp.]PAL24305.1 hypothetical protein CD928_05300 [Sphingopyxis sp. GW247-27LB]BBB09372.1 hypothetical protein SPYCW_2388 [Sphingopyxis sp. EG6]